MDLHGQVLARAERAADAGQHHPHLVFWHAQADRDLRLVHMQPLGGHVQLDPAVLGRHREAGLGPEERLVLHADLVAARDHDAGRGLRVSPPDPHVPDQVAAGVHRLRAGLQRGLGVGDRGQHLVVDRDRGGRAVGCFRVIGRDDHQRLALVTDLAVGQHRLVGGFEAERLAARHVVGGQHGGDPGQPQRSGDVHGPDPGPGVRAAQRRTPQHVRHPHVGGEGELAGHLEGAVGARRAGAHARVRPPGGRGGRCGGGRGAGDRRHPAPPSATPPGLRAAASRTASRIFS